MVALNCYKCDVTLPESISKRSELIQGAYTWLLERVSMEYFVEDDEVQVVASPKKGILEILVEGLPAGRMRITEDKLIVQLMRPDESEKMK